MAHQHLKYSSSPEETRFGARNSERARFQSIPTYTGRYNDAWLKPVFGPAGPHHNTVRMVKLVCFTHRAAAQIGSLSACSFHQQRKVHSPECTKVNNSMKHSHFYRSLCFGPWNSRAVGAYLWATWVEGWLPLCCCVTCADSSRDALGPGQIPKIVPYSVGPSSAE